MRRDRFTNPIWMIAGLLAGQVFAILVAPLFAQTAGNVRRYDATREVTLSGTGVGSADQTCSRNELGFSPTRRHGVRHRGCESGARSPNSMDGLPRLPMTSSFGFPPVAPRMRMS